MKKILIFACIAVVIFTACFDPLDDGVKEGEGGRTFYVSQSDGHDSNDGLSPTTPWFSLSRVNRELLGPGDSVLFKRNDVWACYDEKPPTALVPWGRGAGPDDVDKRGPIIIGAYGTGARPLIEGSGLLEAIRLEKTEYIRVQDLKITNNNSRPYLGHVVQGIHGTQVRRGVYVMAEHIDYNPHPYERIRNGRSTPEYGAMNGIELINLEITDVQGWAMHSNDNQGQGGPLRLPMGNQARWWSSAGIYFHNIDQYEISGQGTTARINAGNPVGHIVRPLVKDCYIHTLSTNAIYANDTPFRWTFRQPDELEYGHIGLRVENTIIRLTGGEAMNNTDGFWEHTTDGNGIYDIGYLDEGHGWWLGVIYTGNNSVHQNNEIGRTFWTGDSHAFDNDLSSFGMSVLQYNYVRDCTGSFLMNWGGTNHGFANTIVRYNILVNVGGGGAEGGTVHVYDHPCAVVMLNTVSNTIFYNNVFYNDKGEPFIIENRNNDRALFVNNIFWNNGPSIMDMGKWMSGQGDGGANPTPAMFYNNLFFSPGGALIVASGFDYPARVGVSFNSPTQNVNPITGDPKFGVVAGVSEPGGAGANDQIRNRNTPGYTGIINGPPLRDIRELAKFFLIDNSSAAHHAGHNLTRKEVEDYIFGRRGGDVRWEGHEPHESQILFPPRRDLYAFNGGKDFFGNALTDNISIGAHNP